MRKLASKLLFCLLIVSVFSAIASGKLVNFKNKYLSLLVDDVNYSFSLKREDLPTRDYSRDLLFYNIPPTSYVSFLVNKLAYRPNEVKIIKPLVSGENYLEFAVDADGVVFSVRFSFVKNMNSLVEDALEISVNFANLTNTVLDVGVRFLLDTVFGEDNTSLPKFYLDGKSPIDYELLLTRDNMVSYVVSTSDIEGVNKLFIQWYGETPSRVLFSNWRKLHVSDWYSEPSSFLNYKFSEVSDPDCAVAIFFEGMKLAPGESKSVKVVLSLTRYYPYVEEEEPKVEVPQTTLDYEVSSIPKEEKPSIPTRENVIFLTNFVTNVVYLTNNKFNEIKEEVKTKEVTKIVPITNEVVVTNVIIEKKLAQDDEIVKRISSIEEKIEKLSGSMDFVLSQLTNKARTLDKKDVEDVEKVRKLKLAMAKLSRTMDTITERVAIINEYINLRKKFSDKRIIVYSEEEYRKDIEVIEEISNELDEIIKILRRLGK